MDKLSCNDKLSLVLCSIDAEEENPNLYQDGDNRKYISNPQLFKTLLEDSDYKEIFYEPIVSLTAATSNRLGIICLLVRKKFPIYKASYEKLNANNKNILKDLRVVIWNDQAEYYTWLVNQEA